MKYKVGDEVLVRVKIIGCSENGVYDVMANRATILETSLIDKIHIREDDIVQDQDMTAEEAWEIAKKLFTEYSDTELDEIFGKEWSFQKLMKLTPRETKDKIEDWKAKKEIKVGDEVVPKNYPHNDECKFFVTRIDNDELSGWSGYDGDVFLRVDAELYQKTGRHIDIDGLLKQIKEDE